MFYKSIFLALTFFSTLSAAVGNDWSGGDESINASVNNEWDRVVHSHEATAYVAANSVEGGGPIKTVWLMRDYEQQINLGIDPITGIAWYPHHSAEIQLDIHCGYRSVGIRSWRLYEGRKGTGNLVWVEKDHGNPTHYVPVLDEEVAALSTVCGTLAAHR